MPYSSLSVESRVKAHISTPYIDADGRGTREAYAKDYAACMLDPSAFRERELGEGPEQQVIDRLEATAKDLAARNEDKSAAVRSIAVGDVVRANADAAEEHSALIARREEAREEEREADTAAHYLLYQKRNESAMAQRAFDESLKPSAEARVRDREELVSKRHRELMALRERANTSQNHAIRQEEVRKAAAGALGEATLARKLSEQAEAERERLREEAKEAFETIVRERERQSQLRRLEEEVRLKKEVQFLVWSRDRDEALVNAQRLATIATEAEAEAHTAEMEAHKALAQGSYATMKELHAKLEALCSQLGQAIDRVNKGGSCLNMLMIVAKEKADQRTTPFRALTRVCQGTYAPTVYTPSVVPRPAITRATVSVQTNVSEPIRQVVQQKGRRI